MCLRRQSAGVSTCSPSRNLKTANGALPKTAKSIALKISLTILAVIWAAIADTNSVARSISNNNQPHKLPPGVASRMISAIDIKPVPVEKQESQVRHGEIDAELLVMTPPPPPPDNGSSGDDILIRVER